MIGVALFLVALVLLDRLVHRIGERVRCEELLRPYGRPQPTRITNLR